MRKFLIPIFVILAFVGGGGLVYFLIANNSKSENIDAQDQLELIRPRSMKITEIGADHFVVSWSTNKEVGGYLRYGDTSNSLSLIAQDVKGAVSTRVHEVRVTQAQPGHKYYFWVMSDNIAFGTQGRALEVLTLSQ